MLATQRPLQEMYRLLQHLALSFLPLSLLSLSFALPSSPVRASTPFDLSSRNGLIKRTYQIQGADQDKNHVLANYFLPTIHLSRLASNSPDIAEEFRRKIALNYFRPSEYATVKQAFLNIHANKKDGDPRLSALKVDVDDRMGLCIKESHKG